MTKFKVAYVHMGADKTGSTALQSFMNRYRTENESKYGIFYAPEVWHARFASYHSNSSRSFIHNVHSGMDDECQISRLDAEYIGCFESWLSTLIDPKVLVFSYEGFHCLESAGMVSMRSYLLQFAEKVRVIYYVRSPISYSLSSMSQHVKMGIRVGNNVPVQPFISLIENIKTAFFDDELTVRLFSRDTLYDNNIISDFMSLLDSNFEFACDIMGQVSANESLSGLACLVGNKAIEKYEKIEFSNYKNNFEFGRAILPFLENIKGERMKLTPNQLLHVLENSKESNYYLSREFGIIINEKPSALSYTSEEMLVFDSGLLRDSVDMLSEYVLSAVGCVSSISCSPKYIAARNEIKTVRDESDIDYLRDEAVRMESVDIKISLRLMQIAGNARPEGPFIEAKIREYQRIINETCK